MSEANRGILVLQITARWETGEIEEIQASQRFCDASSY